ncbi:unnamed protein product [Mesocestoides corti]|uniref:Transposase n=1 Tax=Mesocestoides corti TaxID=53468 RepID=A0A0R3UN39_MESCO|nr:unnamed protein product [Mesocestoides corti]
MGDKRQPNRHVDNVIKALYTSYGLVFALAWEGMEQVLKRLVSMLADRQSSQAAPAGTPSIDGFTNSISEFFHDPENGATFESWCRRYEDLFRVDLAS